VGILVSSCRALHRRYAPAIKFATLIRREQASRRYDAASATHAEKWLIIGKLDRRMDTVVAELVSFLEALKSGSPFHYLILLAVVLIGLGLAIAAVAYQRVVIKRYPTASKATQEDFETIAADLRKRALGVKKQDEGLRKRELEVKGRKQQQVLKRSQRALKGSVSHTMLQTGFKGMTSVVPDSSKAGLQRKPDEAGLKNSESDQEGRQASTQ
jgi:hypothetical protein